jgi:FkbM family methyltransferase
MGSLRAFNLNQFVSQYGCDIYIETGTGICDCFSHAITYPFTEFYSIDIDGQLIDNAKSMFNQSNMHFIHDYSHLGLEQILTTIPKEKTILFFLDAHFPGADFHKMTYKESITQFKEDAFPLMKEINVIKKYRDISKDVFIIDDWFLYEPNLNYEAENTKNWPYAKLQRDLGLASDSDTNYIIEGFKNTHNKTINPAHQGYLVLTPSSNKQFIDFKKIHQSSWLGDLLNKYFPETGTFVEIGVGNIISYDYHNEREKFQNKNWNELPIIGSNTIELLQSGWTGFYIDPEKSFIEQANMLAPDKSKIHTMVAGCGDVDEEKRLGDGESFKSSTYDLSSNGWVGNVCKIKKTDDVFFEMNVPTDFEFLSIDVEGYEEEVLRGLDLNKHKPKAIFIEIASTPRSVIESYLKDYTLIQQDNLNAFYLKNI